MKFKDRQEAGIKLADQLHVKVGGAQVRVFAVPGGGVLVAAPVARRLQVALEVLVVQSSSSQNPPWVGVRTPGGVHMLALDSLEHLLPHGGTHVPETVPATLAGCTAVLIDEGMQSGNTLLAAVQTLWFLGARRVVVAVPCATSAAFLQVKSLVDEVVCLEASDGLKEVRDGYENFPNVTDADVQQVLESLT